MISNPLLYLSEILLTFWSLDAEERKNPNNYQDGQNPTFRSTYGKGIWFTSWDTASFMHSNSNTKTPTTMGLITEEMLSHYFKSPVVSLPIVNDLAPLSTHKDFFNKHLLQGFLTDPRVVLTLKLSLLKLSKLTNLQIASSDVNAIYNKIAILLSDLNFIYHINKERRDSNAKNLHRLTKLQSKWANFQS